MIITCEVKQLNIDTNTKKITETAILSALVAVLYVIALYMPFIPTVLCLTAVPTAYVGVKHGYKYMASMLVVSCFLVMLLSGVFSAIALVVLAGVNGAMLTYAINKNMSKSLMTVGGVLSMTVSYALLMVMFEKISGINIVNTFELSMNTFKDELMVALDTVGTVNSSVSIDTVKDMYNTVFEGLIESVKLLVPYILVFAGLISSVITVNCTTYFFKRAGIKLPESGKFKDFRFDSHVLYGTTIIAVLAYVAIQFNLVNSVTMAFNTLMIIILAFSVQGLANIMFLMDKTKMPVFAKVLIILIILTIRSNYILALLGWLDAIFNFRRIGVKAEK